MVHADESMWSALLMSRFKSLQGMSPFTRVYENDVAEYHDMLRKFEESRKEELSLFKVPERELQRRDRAYSPALPGHLARHTYDEKRSCTKEVLQEKVEALLSYLERRPSVDQKLAQPETSKLTPIGDLVFISYSHKDERWRTDLETHLVPYVRNGSITAWSDKHIQPGSEWFAEIQQALSRAKVAVLLITSAFLASNFIHEHELGPLLSEAKKGGVRILWIPVRASSYAETGLKHYQALCDPAKPLAEMKAERDKVWVAICQNIRDAVNAS